MLAQRIAKLMAPFNNLRDIVTPWLHRLDYKASRFIDYCHARPFNVVVTLALLAIISLQIVILWQLGTVGDQAALASWKADYLRYTIQQTTPSYERVDSLLRYYPIRQQ